MPPQGQSMTRERLPHIFRESRHVNADVVVISSRSIAMIHSWPPDPVTLSVGAVGARTVTRTQSESLGRSSKAGAVGALANGRESQQPRSTPTRPDRRATQR